MFIHAGVVRPESTAEVHGFPWFLSRTIVSQKNLLPNWWKPLIFALPFVLIEPILLYLLYPLVERRFVAVTEVSNQASTDQSFLRITNTWYQVFDAFYPVASQPALSHALQPESSLFVITEVRSIYWLLSLLVAIQVSIWISLFKSQESFERVNQLMYHFNTGDDGILPTWVTKSFHIVWVSESPSFTTSFQDAYHTNTDQSTVKDIANWIRIFFNFFIESYLYFIVINLSNHVHIL